MHQRFETVECPLEKKYAVTAHNKETGVLKKPNHGHISFWTKKVISDVSVIYVDQMTDFGRIFVLFLKKLNKCDMLDTFE